MKLKKPMLHKAFTESLKALGYCYYQDTIRGTQALYVKKIEGKYYLTLGLEISRFYDFKYTASIYLSQTTKWGFMGKSVPRKCYKRVAEFLTLEERQRYLGEYDDVKVVGGDGWWESLSNKDVDAFINTVKLTEPRFLSQENLFKEIDKSQQLAEYKIDGDAVMKMVLEGRLYSGEAQEIPNKPIDGIPIEWFKAAYLYIMETRPLSLNKLGVKILASDAFIRSHFIS